MPRSGVWPSPPPQRSWWQVAMTTTSSWGTQQVLLGACNSRSGFQMLSGVTMWLNFNYRLWDCYRVGGRLLAKVWNPYVGKSIHTIHVWNWAVEPGSLGCGWKGLNMWKWKRCQTEGLRWAERICLYLWIPTWYIQVAFHCAMDSVLLQCPPQRPRAIQRPSLALKCWELLRIRQSFLEQFFVGPVTSQTMYSVQYNT